MIGPELASESTIEPPATVPIPRPAYELPGALTLVGRGFDLIVAASRHIRQASLYIGLLVVLVVGPAVALTVALVAAAPPEIDHLFSDPEAFGEAFTPGALLDPVLERWFSIIGLLVIVIMIALPGVVAITVEAQIMAMAILGGRLAGRPLREREALRRSRQTFWRVVRAAVLVAIPTGMAQILVTEAVGDSQQPTEGATLLGTFVGAFVGAPFCYATCAIVLGDVGAREALIRSVRLARTRWRLAVVIVLFEAVFSSVQVFALGAGGDVVGRLFGPAGLGFDSGPVSAVATLVVILAVIAAIGSLVCTMSAVLVAPQVVAFVGLTHYVAGLDLARISVAAAVPALQPAVQPEPAPPGAAPQPMSWTVGPRSERFDWLTRPMLAGIVAMVLLAVFGIATVVGLGVR